MINRKYQNITTVTDCDFQNSYNDGDNNQRLPEHRLLTYVLQNAIKESFSHEEHLRREARAWIFGRTKNPGFSFSEICDWLEISDNMQRAIKDYVKNPANTAKKPIFHHLKEWL